MATERKKQHGMEGTAIYRKWKHMKQRCSNPNSKDYIYYGARGIRVCEEWHDFRNFIEWARSVNYDESLEIDRIDNDGDYEPSNCQFISHLDNMEVGKRSKYSNNKSGYTGVCWYPRYGQWTSIINSKGVRYHLGYYDNISDALEARIEKEIELFGEQRTNLHYKGGE